MPAAITAALIAAGWTVLAANLVVALGTIIVGVAVSLIGQAIARRNMAANESDAGQRQNMLRQAIPPRVKYAGTVRVSGPVWCWVADHTGSADNMHVGIAVNHGRIGAILEFFLDDTQVEVGSSGNVVTPPYGSGFWSGLVDVLYRLGQPTETAYAELLTAFGWGDARGDGVATVLGIFAAVHNDEEPQVQFEIYPNGPPKIRVTHTGSVVWDWRDPAQDREDESTWESSENPVVHLVNYMMSPEGFDWPWDKIEPVLGLLTLEADVCDDRVPLATGGTEKRYRIAGGWTLTQDPADVVRRFEEILDGRVWQRRDGTLGLRVGRYDEPAVTIGDRDIIAYDLDFGADPFSAISGIRAQFLSIGHNFQPQDADPWPNGTVLVTDPGRPASLDLSWVPSHANARRLMKRAYVKSRAPIRGTITTNLAGLRALDERYINVVISELGIDLSCEVAGGVSIDLAGMQCVIPIVAIDSSIDAWDAATEEGTAPALPLDLADE